MPPASSTNKCFIKVWTFLTQITTLVLLQLKIISFPGHDLPGRGEDEGVPEGELADGHPRHLQELPEEEAAAARCATSGDVSANTCKLVNVCGRSMSYK